MYYGDTCQHCHKMMPLVDALEKQMGVKVERKEVYNNQANNEERMTNDQGVCGGVPYFYNTESKKWICGETSLEKLKEWAQSSNIQ